VSATRVINTAESQALADAFQERELTITIPIATKLKDLITLKIAHRHDIRLKADKSITKGLVHDHQGLGRAHTIGMQ